MSCGSGSDASSAIAVQRDVNKALVSALQVHGPAQATRRTSIHGVFW